MNYPKDRYTGSKPWMDKEWLYEEYVIKDRSTKDIADEYGCKRNTIQQWLAKFQIKKNNIARETKHTKPYQDKEYLYEQHIVNQIPISEIAKNNNVSCDTIKYFLNKYNISSWRKVPPSTLSEEQWQEIILLYQSGVSTYKLEQLYGMGHSNIKKGLIKRGIQTRNQSEAQFNFYNVNPDEKLYDKDWLEFQHWSLGKSCKEIGELLNVDASTVRRHMKSLGIKTKTNSESKIGQMVGDKHPNWKGGITPLNLLLREYFHTNLAPIVAKRDKYTCQKCGTTHTILNVHHIKHFSKIVKEILLENPQLHPNNIKDRLVLYEIITHDKRFLNLENLITLCKTCHIKEHSKNQDN